MRGRDMAVPCRVLLSLLWTALWTSATALEVLAGPWQQLHPDGALSIGLVLDRALSEAERVSCVLQVGDGDHEQVIAATQSPVAAAGLLAGGALLRWQLPARAQRMELVLGQRHWPLDAPPRPAADQEACLLLVGAAGYPDAATVRAIAATARHPLQAVLVLPDSALDLRLGRGGWEQDLPVIVPGPVQDLQLPLAVAAWSGTIAWGRLGLSIVASGRSAQLALARDLSPHRLLVDAQSQWDAQVEPLPSAAPGAWLALCNRQHLPLLISASRAGNQLTDPFTWQAPDELRSAPGGTRILQLDVAGLDPLTRQPWTVRRTRSPWYALLTTLDEVLELRIHGSDGAVQVLAWPRWPERDRPAIDPTQGLGRDMALDAWRDRGRLAEQAGRHCAWLGIAEIVRRSDDPQLRRLLQQADHEEALADLLHDPFPWPMDGLADGRAWGLLDGPALAEAWLEAADEAAAAGEAWSWCLAPDIYREVIDEVAIKALFDRATAQPDLLDRLLACRPAAAVGWLNGLQEPPPPRTEATAILAWLDSGLGDDDARLRTAILRLRDPPTLRILARLAVEQRRWRLQAHLRDRWAEQAAGRLPLDEDPLLQMRLAAAVFASPFLRPRGLEAIAVQLVDRVHPLVRPTVARALAQP